jgi:hypothetical protein
MQDISEVRRKNLVALMEGRGRKAGLAQRLGVLPPVISRYVADRSKVARRGWDNIDTDMARKIEVALALPEKFLDTDHGDAELPLPVATERRDDFVERMQEVDALLEQPVHFRKLQLLTELAHADLAENSGVLRAARLKEILTVLNLAEKAGHAVDPRKFATVLRRARADAKEHEGELRPALIKDLLELAA